jgi:4-hydroxy-2-oxoheptanedioate aldolase
MVLIGPNDLALSLLGRHPAKPDDTQYHAALDRIVEAAHKANKKAGIVVVDGQAAAKAFGKFDFVIMTNEVRAMQAWYRAEVAVAKGS